MGEKKKPYKTSWPAKITQSETPESSNAFNLSGF